MCQLPVSSYLFMLAPQQWNVFMYWIYYLYKEYKHSYTPLDGLPKAQRRVLHLIWTPLKYGSPCTDLPACGWHKQIFHHQTWVDLTYVSSTLEKFVHASHMQANQCMSTVVKIHRLNQLSKMLFPFAGNWSCYNGREKRREYIRHSQAGATGACAPDPLNAFSLHTEVHTNVVCPCCSLALEYISEVRGSRDEWWRQDSWIYCIQLVHFAA